MALIFKRNYVLQISTVIGAALPSERAQNGWTEGVAIWVAVIIVSLVGEPSSCTPVTITAESAV